MSEILSNIVIEQIEATFQPDVSNLNITPNAISLNIYTSAAPIAAGSNTDVQFNLNGALSGSNAFTFNNSTNTVTVDNFIASDSANLGDASNVTILGGTNGYFLQTDGTGNLTWSAGGNGGGNGTPGGSNTQIQYNDSGSFGGNAGFTFNETNGNVNIPGNLIVAGNITGTFTGNASNANYANFAGNVVNSSQPNITSLGTLTSLSVTGTVSAGNVTGNGAGLSSLTGANVTGFVPNAVHANSATVANSANSVAGANVSGQVAFANMANYAGNVTIAAQSNITSLGTLTSLNVAGTSAIQQAIEKVTVNASAATGNINYDLLDQAILNYTANASGNITLNFRGNSTTTLNTVMNSNASMTCTFITSTGPTPYVVANVKVDGTTVTPLWTLPGSAGTGTPSGKDVYTFNLIKTAANAFTVLASRVGYI